MYKNDKAFVFNIFLSVFNKRYIWLLTRNAFEQRSSFIFFYAFIMFLIIAIPFFNAVILLSFGDVISIRKTSFLYYYDEVEEKIFICLSMSSNLYFKDQFEDFLCYKKYLGFFSTNFKNTTPEVYRRKTVVNRKAK